MRPRHAAIAALLVLSAPAAAIEPGEAAPAFALADLGGQTVRSADLAGRVVVVNFWASWCGPCLEELPLLDAMHRDLGDDAVVVAVSVDTSRRRPQVLASRLGLGLPVLLDDGSAASAFAPPAMPTTYLIGPDGAVRSVHTGALDAASAQALRDEIRSLAPKTGP